MTEIKLFTKILLIIEAILWLLFGILLMFLFDLTMNPEGWTNPYLPKGFGGVNFLAGIFAILMLRKKEWEEIKFLFEFFLALLLLTFILEMTVFITIGLAYENSIMSHMFNLIVEGGLFILSLVAYIKQRR